MEVSSEQRCGSGQQVRNLHCCFRMDDVFSLFPNVLGQPHMRQNHLKLDDMITVTVEKFRELLVFNGLTQDELVSMGNDPGQLARNLRKDLLDKAEPRPCPETCDVIEECIIATTKWVMDKVQGSRNSDR